MSNHIDRLTDRYPSLEQCEREIADAVDLLVDRFRRSNKLLIAGNGGSAADADHISAELLKGFAKQRVIDLESAQQLGNELSGHLQGGLPAIPLSQFTSLLTAYANDCNPEYGFAQLVWALGNEGDVLMAISTSGDSKNILHSAEVAKRKGMSVVALTGQSGRLQHVADVSICAPSTVTQEIQELHLPIYHCLCLAIEDALFPCT